MAKYLVTGGAGFIGSNNVAQVANLCYVDRIEFVEGDLREMSSSSPSLRSRTGSAKDQRRISFPVNVILSDSEESPAAIREILHAVQNDKSAICDHLKYSVL